RQEGRRQEGRQERRKEEGRQEGRGQRGEEVMAPVYAQIKVLPPRPINPRWSEGLDGAREMVVEVRDLEGARVVFEVEKRREGGWVMVEQIPALVAGGMARAKAPPLGLIDHPSDFRFRARLDTDPPPAKLRWGERKADEVECVA